MESIRDLINNPMMPVELSGNTCEAHGTKTVHTIIVHGSEVCPICERNVQNEYLSKQESEKIRRSRMKKNHRVLLQKSILTNRNLFEATFGNYKTTDSEEIANKEKAIKVFQKYKEGEVFNTWFTGLPGVGKSHLSMSILRNLNEVGVQDKTCLFISVDEMLLQIRNSFDHKESVYTEHYFVNLLSTVDYLVLDDLGAETGGTGTTKRATDFTLRVLYAVANARQDKSTIITTNLSKNELVTMYDAKLVSRLRAAMALIDFKDTSDKRIRQIEL